MDPTHSFGNSLAHLQAGIKAYEEFKGDSLELAQLNAEMKSELTNMTWLLDILNPSDPNQREIFGRALEILARLNIPLIVDRLNKQGPQSLANDIQQLQDLQTEYSSTMEKTASKMQEWTSSNLLLIHPGDSDLSQLNPTEADLPLASSTSKWPYLSYIASSHGNYIFSPGKMYNPIPCHISRYIDEKFIDNPKRILELISLMKGEEVQGKEEAFFMTVEQQIIKDRYGLTMQAPATFTWDYFRQGKMSLNGIDYLNSPELTPNDFARELYNLCGQAGGHRLMFLCTQNFIAFPLEIYMLGLMDKFAKKIPAKCLMSLPGSVTGKGNRFELVIDPKSNRVEFTGKAILKVHRKQDSSHTGFFVYKINMAMPHDLLIAPNLGEQLAAAMKTTELISTLVVNNQAEAMELFLKF